MADSTLRMPGDPIAPEDLVLMIVRCPKCRWEQHVAHRDIPKQWKHAALLADRDRLAGELESYRKDAERYRWLRAQFWIDDAIMEHEGIKDGDPESLDRAIDASRSADGEGGKGKGE